jgi:hypothetical protein
MSKYGAFSPRKKWPGREVGHSPSNPESRSLCGALTPSRHTFCGVGNQQITGKIYLPWYLLRIFIIQTINGLCPHFQITESVMKIYVRRRHGDDSEVI